jgi:hypothetical protein
MAKKTAGTKPTGPNAKLQGKPLAAKVSPPQEGPVDTPNSNGQWDAKSGCVYPMHQTPVKGTKKSF